MSGRQDKKSAGAKGGRNGDRRNGKAWGRHSGKAESGHRGHNQWGRTKPSGSTVGGHSLAKIEEQKLSREQIAESRNTQHRAQLRRDRKAFAAAEAARKAKGVSSRG